MPNASKQLLGRSAVSSNPGILVNHEVLLRLTIHACAIRPIDCVSVLNSSLLRVLNEISLPFCRTLLAPAFQEWHLTAGLVC